MDNLGVGEAELPLRDGKGSTEELARRPAWEELGRSRRDLIAAWTAYERYNCTFLDGAAATTSASTRNTGRQFEAVPPRTPSSTGSRRALRFFSFPFGLAPPITRARRRREACFDYRAAVLILRVRTPARGHGSARVSRCSKFYSALRSSGAYNRFDLARARSARAVMLHRRHRAARRSCWGCRRGQLWPFALVPHLLAMGSPAKTGEGAGEPLWIAAAPCSPALPSCPEPVEACVCKVPAERAIKIGPRGRRSHSWTQARSRRGAPEDTIRRLTSGGVLPRFRRISLPSGSFRVGAASAATRGCWARGGTTTQRILDVRVDGTVGFLAPARFFIRSTFGCTGFPLVVEGFVGSVLRCHRGSDDHVYTYLSPRSSRRARQDGRFSPSRVEISSHRLYCAALFESADSARVRGRRQSEGLAVPIPGRA